MSPAPHVNDTPELSDLALAGVHVVELAEGIYLSVYTRLAP